MTRCPPRNAQLTSQDRIVRLHKGIGGENESEGNKCKQMDAKEELERAELLIRSEERVALNIGKAVC